jgi:hypothetical protein
VEREEIRDAVYYIVKYIFMYTGSSTFPDIEDKLLQLVMSI